MHPYLDPSCSHAAHVVTLTRSSDGLVLLMVMEVKCAECPTTIYNYLQKLTQMVLPTVRERFKGGNEIPLVLWCSVQDTPAKSYYFI